jgi:hypothetical protein
MKFILLNEATPTTPKAVSLGADTENKLNAGDYAGAYRNVAGTEKAEAFFDAYFNKKFAGKAVKIKDFRKELISLLAALEFKDSPIIEFLLKYIDKNKMTKTGFITLNNLYARGILEDQDFIASDISEFLMSDLFVNTKYEDAEFIVDAYKSLLYGYSNLNSLNISRMNQIVNDKNPGADPRVLLNYSPEGVLPTKGKRELANLIVFQKGQVNNKIDSVDKIKEDITYLKADNPGQLTKDTSRVSLKISPDITPPEEATLDKVLRGFKKEDIPLILRYFKNKKLID